jgi:hypothetical protein
MLHKYKALLLRSGQRLRTEQRRLEKHCQQLKREKGVHQQLQDELEFQRNLKNSMCIDGSSISRQQLFSWLRKTATDQRRTHGLQVDLQRQEEFIKDCSQKLEEERSLCHQLTGRCERYQMLLKEEWKRARLRQENIEEFEFEERASWLK